MPHGRGQGHHAFYMTEEAGADECCSLQPGSQRVTTSYLNRMANLILSYHWHTIDRALILPINSAKPRGLMSLLQVEKVDA